MTDKNGYTPLYYAAQGSDKQCMRLLERYGAKFNVFNNKKMSPMHLAAQSDNAFNIVFLRARGVDPDCVNNEGKTPLHLACEMGQDEAIYYLMAYTQKLNHQDCNGSTPLHSAVSNFAYFNHIRPLKEMLIKGASRDIRDNQGRRPIEVVDHTVQNQYGQIHELEAILGP